MNKNIIIINISFFLNKKFLNLKKKIIPIKYKMKFIYSFNGKNKCKKVDIKEIKIIPNKPNSLFLKSINLSNIILQRNWP
jgi:hypothetical protein